MSEHWTDRFSAYMDGELSGAEAQRLEAHVAACAACAATLAGLRSVVEAARSLPDDEPTADLWPRIEARLRPRTSSGVEPEVIPIATARPPRRIAFSVPQLVAAGLALVLFSAGGVWLAVGGRPAVTAAVAPSSTEGAPGAVRLAGNWEAAVAALELEFQQRRAELDPATVLVVERNLAIIDDAIAQARQALEADPSSGFLSGYVAEAMRRKVDLLRQATRIHRTES